MNDNNLFFRTSGAASLTETETSAALTINGTPAIGLTLIVDVPKQSIGDTMQVDLQHSTNNSTWTRLLSMETVASVTAAITTSIQLRRLFHTRNKYVRTVITVAGTTPDYGAVVARVVNAQQWNVRGVGQNATSNP